jgi:hypothetical protein
MPKRILLSLVYLKHCFGSGEKRFAENLFALVLQDLRNLCVMGAEAWTRTGALSGKEGQGHKTRVSSSVYCKFKSSMLRFDHIHF